MVVIEVNERCTYMVWVSSELTIKSNNWIWSSPNQFKYIYYKVDQIESKKYKIRANWWKFSGCNLGRKIIGFKK
jgi:hypothetical protein